MTSAERVAVIGTGLIGTSIAMAAIAAGSEVRGSTSTRPRRSRGAVGPRARAVAGGSGRGGNPRVRVHARPGRRARGPRRARGAAPDAVVTDVGEREVSRDGRGRSGGARRTDRRFVGGHPMGGSERSGPEFASGSVVDGIVWVAHSDRADRPREPRSSREMDRAGGEPAHPPRSGPPRSPGRDREPPAPGRLDGADEPGGDRGSRRAGDLLLLAAGGFRDLTRLAASSPQLWSDILLANREQVTAAIDLYVARLLELRDLVGAERQADVEAAFALAKEARLSLAAKPQVRAGVAVLQVPIPDRPGSLADLTLALSEARA